MSTSEILSVKKSLAGFVKVWQVDPNTGESVLLVDKQNLILKGGAKLIAHALGGDPAAKIWGMYVGYNNTSSFLVTPPDVDYNNPFSSFEGQYGFLREKLTFSPTYMSSEGYDENTVLFSTMITTASKAGGTQSAEFTGESRIYEVALVAERDPNNTNRDIVFSRTTFNPIQYNSSYNFTITWGVRILLP
jgi:hypothetical protein